MNNPQKDKASETLNAAARQALDAAPTLSPRAKVLALALAGLLALAAFVLSGCAGTAALDYNGTRYTFGTAPLAADPAPTKPTKPAHGCTAPGAKCPPPGAILGE